MSLLKNLYKKQHVNKLLKGRRLLQEKKGLDYLIFLADKLAKTPLKPAKKLYLIEQDKFDLARVQFINQRQLFLELNEAVLLAFSNKKRKIKIGLPQAYLKILEKEGFKATTLQNKIRWLYFGIKWFVFGNLKYFKFIYDCIRLRSNPKNQTVSFDYFDNLTNKNLPQPQKQLTKSIIEWYLEKFPDKNKKNIFHSVKGTKSFQLGQNKIDYIPHPFTKRATRSSILYLISWWIKLNGISLVEFFSGNFMYCILMKEFPYLLWSQKCDSEQLPKKVLFHNTSSAFRPLWTYIAEEKCVEVILYFYSTNNIVPKNSEGKYYTELYNKGYMNWPKYYVWDSYQKDFINYTVKEKNYDIEIVGPIPFESKLIFKKQQKEQHKIASIFEVNVFNDYHNAKIGHPSDYYIPSVLLKFHQDIYDIINSHKNLKGLMKRKRNDHKIHKDYIKQVNKLYASENFKQIDVNTDAESLILSSIASISVPFTSPAIIAKYHGIPSVYYDPVGHIQPDDRGLSGVPLIQNKEDLALWLNSVVK